MSQSIVNELRQAGIVFDRYRELAPPIQDGQGGSRWPLIAATDQVLVALRWKREALAASTRPSRVTPLPTARGDGPAPAASVEWFVAESAPAPAPGKRVM